MAVTDAPLILAARAALASVVDGAQFVGGTDFYFCELNLDRPKRVATMDALTYSITPEIHASDELSLVENLVGQAETVRAARSFCRRRPLVIGNVTLRPRLSYDETSPEPEPAAGELPETVDPRQPSLFAAAWTLGTLKTLAESGVASVTLYETIGWRGVLECEDTSYRTAAFPSLPGGVFPMYHVLRDALEHKDARVRTCTSSARRVADAFVWECAGEVAGLVANLTWKPCRVKLGPLPETGYRVRRLNDLSWQRAALSPEAFRSEGDRLCTRGGRLMLDLVPFETVYLEPQS